MTTKAITAVFLFLTLTLAALADVKIVGEAKVAPNKIVRLSVEAPTDAVVIWDVLDNPEKCDIVEDTADNKFRFTAPPGSYRVKLWVVAGKKKDHDQITVVIGEPPPPDTFTTAVADAVASETDADKTTLLPKLAALYRQAATDTYLASKTTWGQLINDTHATAESFVGTGKLPVVRKALAAEVSKVFPKPASAVLDADGRALAKTMFLKVATALEPAKAPKMERAVDR